MRRRFLVATSLACLALLGAPSVASAANPTVIALNLPGATAFSILGASCGGIRQQDVATGFDSATGFPMIDVYLRTSCSSGGRGAPPHVYTAWALGTFDFTGALVTAVKLSGAASPDPTATPTDVHGNQLSTSVGAINVLPANCTIFNTVYCSYSAWLTRSASFVPVPRVLGLSTSVGPTGGGTGITVTGTGFSSATGVSFGTAPPTAFAVLNDTTITATAPMLPPGTYDVTVTSTGGTSSAAALDQFTAVARPTVQSLAPRAGLQTGGNYVTIHGLNLTRVTSVSIGGVPTGFQVLNDTTLSAYVPGTDSYGPVAVSVASPGGTSPAATSAQYVYAPTSCTSQNPCEAAVSCAKVTGSFSGTMTVSACSPRSSTALSARFQALGVFTWAPSAKSTVTFLSTSSPGRGICAAGHLEQDLAGAVLGGSSSVAPFGDPLHAVLCISKATHAVTLAAKTKFLL